MGCDIHAMYEYRKRYSVGSKGYWKNGGNPDIDRNYTIFSILGNVRNSDNMPFIGEERLLDGLTDWFDSMPYEDQPCTEFVELAKYWGRDGHSHSFVTLTEMKLFDVHQKYTSSRLITSKDDAGNITSTCSGTNGPHFGEVGETEIFGVWGTGSWDRLVAYGDMLGAYFGINDEDIRLVFLFDN